MSPTRIVIAVLCFVLVNLAPAQTQEMDKELAEVAGKLATLIKDNGKKKVTVLDFTDLQGASSELGKYVAEELTVNLVMVKKEFAVLDRANLRKILDEHKLTATGLIDPVNAKKLGQFSGVDALVLGTITQKNQKINLTAKIIATDTAEIVGAAKGEFKSDEAVQQLLSQAAKQDDANETNVAGSSPPTVAAKPFGDLQTKVESLKLLPGGNNYYGFTRLTLIITNTSSTKTYGVSLNPDFYSRFSLSNNRGDEFITTEVSGIDTAFEHGDGDYRGSFTDIPPKTAITIVAKSQATWKGKAGDYRPYRLQTVVAFGEESQGRHPDIKKFNLVLDIK